MLINSECFICPDCGGTVSKEAKKCPHCGRNSTLYKKRKWKLIIFSSIILSIFVIICCCVNQRNKDIAEGQRILSEQAPDLKRMIQFAENPEDMKRMEQSVRDLRLDEGMSFHQATNIVITAKQYGKNDQIKFYGQSSRIFDPIIVMQSVAVIQKTFGKEKAGTRLQIINMLLKGVQISGISIEELAPTVAEASEESASIGSTPAELIAVICTMASKK